MTSIIFKSSQNISVPKFGPQKWAHIQRRPDFGAPRKQPVRDEVRSYYYRKGPRPQLEEGPFSIFIKIGHHEPELCEVRRATKSRN